MIKNSTYSNINFDNFLYTVYSGFHKNISQHMCFQHN